MKRGRGDGARTQMRRLLDRRVGNESGGAHDGVRMRRGKLTQNVGSIGARGTKVEARGAAPDNLKQVTCGTGELICRALGAIIHEEDDPGTKWRRRRSSGP